MSRRSKPKNVTLLVKTRERGRKLEKEQAREREIDPEAEICNELRD